MQDVDAVLAKGLDRIRDVVGYYTQKLENDNADEEDDNDDDGADRGCFIETMLIELDDHASTLEENVSDRLHAIRQWSALQHPLPWSTIRHDLADGIWHAAYDRYKSWHFGMKRKAGDDPRDFDYVDGASASKRQRRVSLTMR